MSSLKTAAMIGYSIAQAQYWYKFFVKWFTLTPPLVGPLTFFVDAPFGRFSLSKSIFLLDGVKSWIFMELVSPIVFIYTFLKSPLLPMSTSHLSLKSPQAILASMYLLHYLNRAILSPLRTPSRSKSHAVVLLFAIGFNIVNGALMGSYLASPAAAVFLADAYGQAGFWVGIGIWTLGLAGNILHDEILLNIRRKAKAKGKAKELFELNGDGAAQKSTQEHYAIPHGALYKYISYPNYFCEWIEWAGFAFAAAPVPSFHMLGSLGSLAGAPVAVGVGGVNLMLTPPWVFALSEVFTMFPRAWRGHKWYHERFAEYPKERKAVIPFLI